MRLSFVPMFVNVTLAARTAAPDGSEMVPAMEPRNVWLIIAAGSRMATVQTSVTTALDAPPPVICRLYATAADAPRNKGYAGTATGST